MSSITLTNGLRGEISDWSQINWRKVKKSIRNLRMRIFGAQKSWSVEEVTPTSEAVVTKPSQFALISATNHSN